MRKAIRAGAMAFAIALSWVGATGAQEKASWDPTRPLGKTRSIDFNTTEGSWMSLDVSPDGRWIVFDLLGHVYRVPIAGGTAECLTQDSGIAVNFHPRYSPDGASIAFVSERRGFYNLWVMGADGSHPRIVRTEATVLAAAPVWTGDGGALIAQRVATHTADRYQNAALGLWRYPLDGGEPSRLTAEQARMAASATLSADDESFYYHYLAGSDGLNIDLTRDDFKLARQSLRNAKEKALTLTGGIAPQASPDGRWLAFARRLPDEVMTYRGHQYGPRNSLWLRNLHSGVEKKILDPIDPDIADGGNLNSEVPTMMPGYAWMPDSSAIVIAQGGKMRRVEIATGEVKTIPFTARVHRVISESAHARYRVSDAPLQPQAPRWAVGSSVGGRFAFQAVGRIWVVDKAGGKPRRLTPETFAPLEFMPAWSADGRWLAFVGVDESGATQVWKSAVDGALPVAVTPVPGEYVNPIWNAAGNELIAVAGCGALVECMSRGSRAPLSLVRIDVATGHVKMLAALSAANIAVPVPSIGPDGRVYFTDHVFQPFEPRTQLISIETDGTDRRVHLDLPFANAIVVSPDGRHVAVEKRSDVFLMTFDPDAPMRTVARDELLAAASSDIRRLNQLRGVDPRWLDSDRLQFTSGDYSVHRLSAGKTHRRALNLSVPRGIARGSMALRGARIVTLKDRQVIERGDLVTRDGRISCVGDCSMDDVEHVIDVSGKTLIPGFVDMHNHSGFPGRRDELMESRDREAEISLAYGTTTGYTPSQSWRVVYPTADLIEAGVIVGPRLLGAADYYRGDSGINGTSFNANSASTFVEFHDAAQVTREARKNAAQGAVIMKNLSLSAAFDRQQLARAAREAGLGISGHLKMGFHEYTLSLAMEGYGAAQHLPPHVPLYSDVAQFFGQAGFQFNTTFGRMGSIRNDGFFVQESEYWKDPKLQQFLRPGESLPYGVRLRELRPVTDYAFPLQSQFLADVTAAGGRAAVGAHGPGYALQWDIWMVASAMGPMGALEAASLHGAALLGAERDLGSLERGKVADVLVLDGNPLEDIRNTARIRYVVKSGVLRDGTTLQQLWPAATRKAR